MQSIAAQVADQLITRGALKPSPGSDHPDVKNFHPVAPCPGTGGLVNFYRVNADGSYPTQAFLNWQNKTDVPLAMEIYMPHRSLLQWMRGTLPELTSNPLSPGYQDTLHNLLNRLIKAWGVGLSDEYFGASSKKPASHPRHGLDKEYKPELRMALGVLHQHPEILHTVALFQGMQLHYLFDLVQELEQRNALTPREVRTFPKTIQNLAALFDSARFFSVAIWTAVAYAERQKKWGAKPEVQASDFAAGWAKLRTGGGFSTVPNDVQKVQCPYEKVGSHFVASELCSRPDARVAKGDQTAHGLWCIYQTVRHQSAPGEGPHADSLATIRDVLSSGTLSGIYSEHDRKTSFRSKIKEARRRIRIKAIRKRFPARAPVETQERPRVLALA